MTTIALDEVVRLVKKILKENTFLVEFRMGCGTYYFLDSDGMIYDEDIEKDEFGFFMFKWDHILHISSNPMKISKGVENEDYIVEKYEN